MKRLRLFYRSTPGQKAVAALTGLILFLFVTMHMVGNLKALTGFDADGGAHLDHYAHFLRTVGEPAVPNGTILWLTRGVLLIAFVVHIATVVKLAKRNRDARPIHYEVQPAPQSFAARSMLWTGVLLAGFVVFHILHFTTGTIRIGAFEHGAVYANVFASFRHGFAAALYIGMMVVLALHLYHGVWSMFQTLGLDNPDRNRGLRLLALGGAVVVAGGFVTLPLLFFLGVLGAPPGGA